jgi:hypothetical protein
MCDVFISYAREDRSTAEHVAKALERRNWAVWWDRGILAGQSVDATIEAKLAIAGCIVVLWSRSSVDSEYVKDEARRGRERGVLVPALLDAGIDLSFRFQDTHAEDLAGWRGNESDPRFVKFIQAVEQKLPRSVGESEQKLNVYIPGGGFGGAQVVFSPDLPKLVYPIGDVPLLYRLLDSLDPGVVKRVVIINKKAPELIATMVELRKDAYAFDVICHEVDASSKWPQALKNMLEDDDISDEFRPNGTFLIQLCDVILHGGHWDELVQQHFWNKLRKGKERRSSEKGGGSYLGTLVISSCYSIKAGIVKLGQGGFVADVVENPEGKYLEALVNTGTAVLESEVLNFVKPDDLSLLGGAIDEALNKNNSFGGYI